MPVDFTLRGHSAIDELAPGASLPPPTPAGSHGDVSGDPQNWDSCEMGRNFHHPQPAARDGNQRRDCVV